MENSILVNDILGGEVPKSTDTIVNVEAVDDDLDMWGLAVQPREVLHQIFTGVDVHDTLNLSLTCRYIHKCIAHDDLLWKEQYLKLFDEPLETPQSWQVALKKLLTLKRFLRTGNRIEKEDRLEDVANTAIGMLISSRSSNPLKNEAFWADLMATRSNKSCFLSRSSLFSRAGHPLDTPADTEALRQLSAKLHVYYGTSIELNEVELEAQGAREIHPFARSRVYDLRRYTTQNGWGPFANDGSGKVDWEKVQAIVTVLSCGLRILSQRFSGIMGSFWGKPFHGLAANGVQANNFGFPPGFPVKEEETEFAGQDPYNIRGTWMRVVNFLDYHDLFAYNFQPPVPAVDEERPPLNTKEAIRLIWLQLKVTRIEEAQEGDDPSMPRVHFKGESRSLTNSWDPNANSGIRGVYLNILRQHPYSQITGYVRKTVHGDIRWTSFSVFGGEERWRSECVQIGDVNSARGAVGNWFDKNYDMHGPAGPTAFWKISDDIMKAKGPISAAAHAYHHHFHLDEEFFTSSDDEGGDDEEEEEEEDDDDEDQNDDNENDEIQEETGDDQVQGQQDRTAGDDEAVDVLPGEAQPPRSQTEIMITVTDGVITAVETRET